MNTIRFPESPDDLDDAFSNALESGMMQRDYPAKPSYWCRHEFVAHDLQEGVDIFWNELAGQYVHVPRKGVIE